MSRLTRIEALASRMVRMVPLSPESAVAVRVWCWHCGTDQKRDDCHLWWLAIARLRPCTCSPQDPCCETFPAFLCPRCGDLTSGPVLRPY